ncbi:hypothetical protein QJQ45_024397, partial [Haematococcus lacustris]
MLTCSLQAGLVDYLAIIRHRSLTLCPVFALATYLFHRFTIKGEELFLHEPLHLRFTTVPLIAGGKIGQALSYSGMNNVYKKLYAEYGLELGATTHATRKGGSAEMSTLGLELDIIKKHCGWSKDVADKHYLTEPRIEPALAMCDWPYQQDKWDEAFHALRFDIPLEYAWLVGEAAPHLFPMFTSLEQISMDGGREESDSRAIFKKLFETFEEFVCVLCQDSIWMLLNNSEKFSSHIVCRHMMSCPGYVEILNKTHSLWQSGQLAARQPVGVKDMLRAMDRRQQLEQQQQREWQQQWQPSAPPAAAAGAQPSPTPTPAWQAAAGAQQHPAPSPGQWQAAAGAQQHPAPSPGQWQAAAGAQQHPAPSPGQWQAAAGAQQHPAPSPGQWQAAAGAQQHPAPSPGQWQAAAGAQQHPAPSPGQWQAAAGAQQHPAPSPGQWQAAAGAQQHPAPSPGQWQAAAGAQQSPAPSPGQWQAAAGAQQHPAPSPGQWQAAAGAQQHPAPSPGQWQAAAGAQQSPAPTPVWQAVAAPLPYTAESLRQNCPPSEALKLWE